MEVWRRIPGYPNYEVSSYGRVRRRDSRQLLTLRPYKEGYREAALYKKGKMHFLRVHRLVALTFLGKPPPGKNIVCHIDDVKHNNRLSNLKWGSRLDNAADAIRNGRYKRGKDAGRAILTERQVLMIRKLYRKKKTSTYLARRFKVARGTIYKIVQHVTWKHLP